ncbi:D-alanyl-D-alanine carboxypeptidase family protein [Faecalicatena contorta]|uniref:serine-type D-Ala-D-Ala carboxypeptidase n=1 Tax=Faecalicatena contorta TaxID=39482 RepID=A0A316A640_9FIRM|nr:D-alanyl-D-alanine carboxypeptidase family protein [Faecalicatena contorta]PWJ52254.1 D-alanyl-D-alanine carboxypeptidase (penicillin-binding protein 5/6) [Faecalicatena contorta]SUQ12532.1 D-alanyl-D-alanine carboxypeptidase (penicillin-binding protein 5/6) [Faecalicatena contorta]
MKQVLAVILSAFLCMQNVYAMPAKEYIVYEDTQETVPEDTAEAQETVAENTGDTETAGPEISAPSAILMEASTGEVIYEKDGDTPRPPASVTKVMTMLLIFDALEAGKIKLEDQVTVSEFAASMGGSQVFLEPGETQTVETMLKCISVASANDACVAMAEYICGSEDEFVRQMNERAKGLGMENTNFVNCNGLDADGHVTSARDIALMSRELILKYPKIQDYCMIWMENITHTTKKGTSEFGLTNTNKLVRQYEYATGLKTGSTGLAKFCVSATAKKNDIEMIAVIMAAEDSKARFKDATTLLSYGFGKCQLYKDENPQQLKDIEVKGGVEDMVPCEYADTFRYLDTTGANLAGITKKVNIAESLEAPVKKGDVVGNLIYEMDGKKIGKVDIIVSKNVKKAGLIDYFKKIMEQFRT